MIRSCVQASCPHQLRGGGGGGGGGAGGAGGGGAMIRSCVQASCPHQLLPPPLPQRTHPDGPAAVAGNWDLQPFELGLPSVQNCIPACCFQGGAAKPWSRG